MNSRYEKEHRIEYILSENVHDICCYHLCTDSRRRIYRLKSICV
nr:hypothetical protein [uncultured Thomasclavelia sp.]